MFPMIPPVAEQSLPFAVVPTVMLTQLVQSEKVELPYTVAAIPANPFLSLVFVQSISPQTVRLTMDALLTKPKSA